MAKPAAKQKDNSKELQLRPRIMEHDLATKLRRAEGWLADGLNVNLVVAFRGEEQSEPAAQLCDTVLERLDGRARVDKPRRVQAGAWRVTLKPPPQKRTQPADAAQPAAAKARGSGLAEPAQAG
ncbi:hypothetical protein GPECTOR_22g808 [Gonium pectorale]|uniref:Translation initiation factor 3 C-terminal domain-containing protein n=1 Tax=Gonium pectorale TaxID=33097 RepID=A0A150GHD0_GONPE|nr:hypothetical protein GPECTOR_22g808 [Gonium pectorale]|eukprot:KXZ49217.1 hypothetical protein GPECTOR_22g808 [Gonium pectorale]